MICEMTKYIHSVYETNTTLSNNTSDIRIGNVCGDICHFVVNDTKIEYCTANEGYYVSVSCFNEFNPEFEKYNVISCTKPGCICEYTHKVTHI